MTVPSCYQKRMLIGNLIIEYVGEETFVSFISRNRDRVNVVSCTIQKNLDEEFVSHSSYTSAFDTLLTILHNANAQSLKKIFAAKEFSCSKVYSLPNGKQFIRLDFEKY